MAQAREALWKSFASDNNAGVHPAVLQALTQANRGHAVGYGDDPWTRSALDVLRNHFGAQAEGFFVFLGTAANVLGFAAVAMPHQAVVLADVAHANVDECGAPERFAGCKLLPVASEHGKIGPEQVAPLLEHRGFVHHSQPRLVSITQCTELGTVYAPDEIRALADFCHANGLLLHMDGARLANAAAFLGTDLRGLTTDAGVDLLSLGGTKNGLMYGEAVVFLTPGLAGEFPYIRKQGMQLASKMRYIAAQFQALLGTDLWLENARHANAMAQLLARDAARLPQVRLTRPVESNAVFATLPAQAIERLRQDYYFYTWDPALPEVRWMTAFDTAEEDVQGFIAALERALG